MRHSCHALPACKGARRACRGAGSMLGRGVLGRCRAVVLCGGERHGQAFSSSLRRGGELASRQALGGGAPAGSQSSARRSSSALAGWKVFAAALGKKRLCCRSAWPVEREVERQGHLVPSCRPEAAGASLNMRETSRWRVPAVVNVASDGCSGVACCLPSTSKTAHFIISNALSSTISSSAECSASHGVF